MKIVWDESNEVGVEAIDRQHKRFIGIVNKIFTLIVNNRTTQADLKTVISELAAYATYRFATEEKYFKEYQYKGAKEHIKAHDMYCEKMSDLMMKIDDPKTSMLDLSEEIANFSVKWLTRHMLSKDKAFAVWLKKNAKKKA